MSIADEAKNLAVFAEDIRNGDEGTFTLEPEFHGRGAEVIAEAEAGKIEHAPALATFTVRSETTIHIQG